MELQLISAGAAKGLVEALQAPWTRDTGVGIRATFGAVGAMRDLLQGGAPCDVLILTQVILEDLAAAGHVDAESIAPLGDVSTGVAIRAGDAVPCIDTRESLERALSAASELYFPDPRLATAGIHFAAVMQKLGIAAALADRLRPHPNGATAMRALADLGQPGALGCTQVTEILYTEGVALVGALPQEFALSTRYATAVASRSRDPVGARRFSTLLAAPGNQPLRAKGGFESALRAR